VWVGRDMLRATPRPETCPAVMKPQLATWAPPPRLLARK
jgi:hypothetical protein